jgi:hypothetical protein
VNLGILARGRARAESLMDSTVRAETVTVTADPTTGADVVTAVAIYEGAAKVKGATQSTGAIPATVASESIHFPAAAPVILRGTRITVLDSANQPNLVGIVYRATRSHLAEFQTAQRVEVESWQ